MRRILMAMGGHEVGWSRWNDEGHFRDYTAEANRLSESAKNFDLEFVLFNNDSIFKSEFYPQYQEVLDKVSFGFAFKSVLFWQMLQKMEYGDVAIFTDSNHRVNSDPQPFFDIAVVNGGILARNHPWNHYTNGAYTRMDTFVNMGCTEQRYYDSIQCQHNIVCVSKNDFSMKFMKEFLDYCLDPKVMFGENKHLNLPEFVVHRHEQSIFSIMVEKYHIPYVLREQCLWMENILEEMPVIDLTSDRIVDNTWRRDEDHKESA